MRCPFCGTEESKVVDSRDSESGDSIRRRRECLHCGRRYTTYERVEETPLLVIKRNGREEVFTRAKLLNGLLRACEKRGIPWRVSSSSPTRSRVSCGASRCSASPPSRSASARCAICRELDKVAYVRFASVYRQFEDIDEFQEELARL